MKSIVFFIGPFGSGGGERNCCNLANAFVREGISVTVVAIGVRDVLFLDRFDSRVKFVNLGKSHLREAFLPIIRFMIENNPPKVLSFNHYIATGLQVLRTCFGFQFELYMRNIVGLTKKYEMNTSFWQGKITKIAVKNMIRHVDCVIAQCNAMAEDLNQNWQISSDKLKVIYNPVAEEIENAHSSSKAKNQEEILYVGRLSEEKGISHLLRALKILVPKYPNLKLRLLGEGPLEHELKKLALELDIMEHIIFQGFVNDTVPFYQNASVTVLPSYSEGFPNVLIESITIGTPVVAFDCETGPSEIIKEDLNGFLVELGNEPKLIEAIHKALTKDWKFKVEDYRIFPIAKKYMETLNLC